MAFGILDDHKLDNVPGTGLLSDKTCNQMTAEEARGLKRGAGKHSHIVLIPQPSDDPHDPLNWPRWKKEACFWMLVFTTSVAAALLGIVHPAYVQLSKEFDVSVDEIASSFSSNLLGTAAFTLVQNPFAIKYGHRVVYIVSSLLMLVSCIWSAVSPDLGSLRVSRFIQGLGEAAPQCLIAVTIEHLYLAITINSYVTQNLSWKLGFWFLSIACGLSFIGVLLFVPETTYKRDRVGKSTKYENVACKDKDKVDEIPPQTPAISNVQVLNINWHCHDVSPLSPPTYISELKIYNGTFSNESVCKIFLQQFRSVLSPMTLFAFICRCIPTLLLSLVTQCASTIFTIEYGFTTTQIGLVNLTGIVGIALAMLVTWTINDWVIVQMSQRNHGIYEPEYRLVFMHGMVISVFAYAGWAVGYSHHMPWIGAVACLTTLSFGLAISLMPPLVYLIDTHGANAVHIITLVMFARNILSYGATFFANRVVLARGVNVFLFVLAACEAACWLMSVVMYVFGKRVRSFIARHPRFFGGDLQENYSPQSKSKQ
ncbi:MFS general substrate transporter [Ganoderma sinense ZZ0214-1]|uniref:MFS general substrate transporter n=1 Tax=Ganoderma sinense ZZ0214-1 TaxID=1077348 RepID=A0A2G8SBJ2_9APHY|nr:MFS general substrate transporter [Ganoderma sinense ZZ0214-1]